MKKQALLGTLGAALLIGAGLPAHAQNGFYGGVSIRDRGAESGGITLGDQPLAWNRFTVPVSEDTKERSLFFGGYRWKNDVAVEAAINTSASTADKYALRPSASGLTVGPGLGLTVGEIATRSWNADVYTSWEMIRRLSLYGRLGYAQNELRPLFSGASLVQGDPRRLHDGVNYGVGLRYDMTHSLGLRVEYSRFGRFVGETALGGSMPESDQLTIGVQYRF